MRHIYIRSFLALIWLIAAIFCTVSGIFPMAGLYFILCGVFFFSARAMWKKEKDRGHDRGVNDR